MSKISRCGDLTLRCLGVEQVALLCVWKIFLWNKTAVRGPCGSPGPVRYRGKGQSNSSTGLDRPWRFQEVESSQISRQWAHEGGKVVSPRQRPPLTHNKYFWYLFLLEVENLMSMKNFNDTIGNWNRDLPAHSAVFQLSAPPRAAVVDIVLSPRQVQTTRRISQKNVTLNVHYLQKFKIFINVFCDADAPSLCHKWTIFILQKYFNMAGGNCHLTCNSPS